MNPVELLRLDDKPDATGNHLTPAQRLAAFEHMWSLLTDDQKTKLAIVTGWAEVDRRVEAIQIPNGSFDETA